MNPQYYDSDTERSFAIPGGEPQEGRFSRKCGAPTGAHQNDSYPSLAITPAKNCVCVAGGKR